jgi:hypothetical protein
MIIPLFNPIVCIKPTPIKHRKNVFSLFLLLKFLYRNAIVIIDYEGDIVENRIVFLKDILFI